MFQNGLLQINWMSLLLDKKIIKEVSRIVLITGKSLISFKYLCFSGNSNLEPFQMLDVRMLALIFDFWAYFLINFKLKNTISYLKVLSETHFDNLFLIVLRSNTSNVGVCLHSFSTKMLGPQTNPAWFVRGKFIPYPNK